MKILLAHPGTQHSHRLAEVLFNQGSLHKFCTSLSFGTGGFLNHVFPQSLRSRRQLAIPASYLTLQPLLELLPFLLKMGISHENMYSFRNSIFQRCIYKTDITAADAIIGFDTSSLILANRAKRNGTKYFLELTTPHPKEKQEILKGLKMRYPMWMEDYSPQSIQSITLEDKEVKTAFLAVAPSQYVKNTYIKNGYPEEKILINPYGVALNNFTLKSYSRKKKIRFLFLGSFTANKGVPLLLEAWKKINSDFAELVVAGYGKIPDKEIIPAGVQILGRIESKDRMALFHSADVFICPSFYEGLALVQLEAMGCGLPIIGTYNSGASEFITFKENGFVIEPGDTLALVERMEFFIRNPECIEDMGRRAHARVQDFTWETYANKWLHIIRNQMS